MAPCQVGSHVSSSSNGRGPTVPSQPHARACYISSPAPPVPAPPDVAATSTAEALSFCCSCRCRSPPELLLPLLLFLLRYLLLLLLSLFFLLLLLYSSSSGTVSAYMAVCHSVHVPREADLIFVEYSVNDPARAEPPWGNEPRAALERLVRSLLRYPRSPAVVLLHAYSWHTTSGSYWRNAEAELHDLATFYHLPELSVKVSCGGRVMTVLPPPRRLAILLFLYCLLFWPTEGTPHSRRLHSA